jgi:hypothetical protein
MIVAWQITSLKRQGAKESTGVLVNMNELIAKLQKYCADTDGKGTSFETMLEATAWFRRELPALIDELMDTDIFIQELEMENIELRRQLKQGVKLTA